MGAISPGLANYKKSEERKQYYRKPIPHGINSPSFAARERRMAKQVCEQIIQSSSLTPTMVSQGTGSQKIKAPPSNSANQYLL